MRRIAVVFAALATVPAAARADDPTAAAAAFRDAVELEKQGKWPEACPLYEASYRGDPQLGVLLHLADCNEHIGRLATAAAEFDDAVELAHRKGDSREAYAQSHADGLKPRLAHLHLAPPATPIPGLVVGRDGVDITVLVGTDIPTDPGEHEIVASAPGRIEWRKKITIGVLPTTTPLDIPPLELAPVATEPPIAIVKPEVHDGSLRVTTQPDAHIFIESREVGVGHYEAPLRPGGYVLRVVAPGMRTYQSEVVIGDGEPRVVDVALERDFVAPPVEPSGPSFELGASIAPGVKLHGDHPVELAYRGELALRRGRRVNFGVYFEYGQIDPNSGLGACGTDLPGSKPTTPFDFGPRDQFTDCQYMMMGLQWYVHILPTGRFNPYVGLAPGFRLEWARYTPFDAAGAMQTAQHPDPFIGIVADVRVGIDYHPTPTFRGWQVGALVSAEVTVVGQESPDGGADTYLSLFGGLRSTIQF